MENQLSRGRRLALVALLVPIALLPACYTVGFHSVEPVASKAMSYRATLHFPKETATYTYDVRSVAAGIVNKFTIRVGEILQEYGHAYLDSAFPEGEEIDIEIRVDGFDVHDFEAHIDSTFTVRREGARLFQKSYHANGAGHFAQTMWAGVFAMKSSMRKTTDEALRSLYAQFLADAESARSSW
jgi:hypothetical protein